MAFRKKQNTGQKLAIGAALGGVAGYLAGILTAPKSGKETRKDIAAKSGEVKDESAEQLQKAVDELNVSLKAAKEKTVAMSAKVRQDFDETVVKAKDAQNKASQVLKAVKAGEADNPELNKAVKQARQATKNLAKYLRS